MGARKSTNELLIRIDERQQELLKHTSEIEAHLKELNGSVSRNKENILRLAYSLIIGTTIWIKESRDFIISIIKYLL